MRDLKAWLEATTEASGSFEDRAARREVIEEIDRLMAVQSKRKV